jgi:Flp pilus assembly protein TadG
MRRPVSASRHHRSHPGPVARPSERGQVLVLVLLGMFVLFGAAALGIDGGRLFEERRAAQGAADHAATAAAFARCTGATSAGAIAQGLAAAARNGYGNDATTNTVTLTERGGNVFDAAITSSVGATFGRVLGFDLFPVTVEATGDCSGGGPGNVGAIWAGGDSCTKNGNGKYSLDVSGSSQRVYGGVRSNADVNIGSSPNWWTDGTGVADPFEYVGVMYPNSAPSGNTFEAGYPKDIGPTVPFPGWPTGYRPEDVALRMAELNLEGLATTNGTRFTSKVTSLTKNGVIWTNHPDGMDISSIAAGVDRVTLIATNGPIRISASSRTFRAHTGGILMLSNRIYSGVDKCDKFTIAISGGTSTWDGLLWAPGGLIEFSGSNTSTVNGTMLGWAVRLNGSNITIASNPALFATAPSVVLLE